MPGYIVRADEGVETWGLEIVDDRIVAMYIVRNPDKVKHLA
jgi:RNA polymerase sigma-70 factor, ECF subfamily